MKAIRKENDDGDDMESDPPAAQRMQSLSVHLIRASSRKTVGSDDSDPTSQAMLKGKGLRRDVCHQGNLNVNQDPDEARYDTTIKKNGGSSSLDRSRTSSRVTTSYRAQRQQAIEAEASDCHDNPEGDQTIDETPGAVAVYLSSSGPSGNLDGSSSMIADTVGTLSSTRSRGFPSDLHDSTLTVVARLVDETEQVIAQPAPDEKYVEEQVQRRLVRKLFKYGLCCGVLLIGVAAAGIALGVFFGVSQRSTSEDITPAVGAGNSTSFSSSDRAEHSPPTSSPTDDSEDSESSEDSEIEETVESRTNSMQTNFYSSEAAPNVTDPGSSFNHLTTVEFQQQFIVYNGRTFNDSEIRLIAELYENVTESIAFPAPKVGLLVNTTCTILDQTISSDLHLLRHRNKRFLQSNQQTKVDFEMKYVSVSLDGDVSEYPFRFENYVNGNLEQIVVKMRALGLSVSEMLSVVELLSDASTSSSSPDI